jgi:hypothetical protein
MWQAGRGELLLWAPARSSAPLLLQAHRHRLTAAASPPPPQVSHHIHCNDDALDEDVMNAMPFLRFDPRLPRYWYHKYQHIYMWFTFPLLQLVFQVGGRGLVGRAQGGAPGQGLLAWQRGQPLRLVIRAAGVGDFWAKSRAAAAAAAAALRRLPRLRRLRRPLTLSCCTGRRLPPDHCPHAEEEGAPLAGTWARRTAAARGAAAAAAPAALSDQPGPAPSQIGDWKALMDNRTVGATLYGASDFEKKTLIFGKVGRCLPLASLALPAAAASGGEEEPPAAGAAARARPPGLSRHGRRGAAAAGAAQPALDVLMPRCWRAGGWLAGWQCA